MTSSIFQQTLNIFLPYIAPCFVQKNLSHLQHIASCLPSTNQGGFEVRLGYDEPQVDIQQCVAYNNEKIAKLNQYIKRYLCHSLPWQRVKEFTHHWQNSLNDAISEMWLEIDSDTEHVLPVVFLGIHPNLSTSVAKKTINDALQILGVSKQQLLQVMRCIDNCWGNIRISHIGIMLSRNVDYLRVNIKGLDASTALQYLHRLEWCGDSKKLQELLKMH